MESESRLLCAARALDQEALVEIFDLYSGALYSYALRLCNDPVTADHIVGDVFVRLLEQLAAGNGPTSNLRSYLYQSAYHLIIDEARYSRRTAPLEVSDWKAQGIESMLRLHDPILLQHILHAMRHDLTEDQRHVIVLRFLEDFSIRETATIMGITESNVKVIQNRAVAALRKALESRHRRTTVLSPKRKPAAGAVVPGVA